ncbi:uncharacterized protein [Cherax quadricarinatus]
MAARVLIVLGSLMVMNVRGSVMKCQTPGRFPHPEDCGSYVNCVPAGDNGQLTAEEGHCFGFPYSPAERRCVSHNQQPGCTTIGLKYIAPVPALQFLCEDQDSAAGCYNCKTAYECIDATAYADVCDNSESCTDYESFGGGACLPIKAVDSTGSCLCIQIGLMADSYNESFYMYCDPNTDPKTMDLYQCDEGEVFSPDTLTCEEPQPTVPTQIPLCDGSTETRVNPYDCSYSYTCLPDGTVRTSYCGADKYYDENAALCEDKCSFVTTTPSVADMCPEIGNQPDPTDCTKYYVCLIVGQEPYKVETCPAGYFDSESLACTAGLLPDYCTAFDYSQCPGYNNLNC